MDTVYGLYNRQASSQIHIKDYFSKYGELLRSFACNEIGNPTEEKIFQIMDVKLFQTKEDLITHYCSIDNLTFSEESDNKGKQKQMKYEPVDIPKKILDNTQLETIKVLQTIYGEASISKLKYQNGISIKYEKSELHADNNIIPTQDCLVYIKIYDPFKQNIRRIIKYNSPSLRFKSIIAVLGRQTLSELRDKIMCPSDLSISTEISKKPNNIIGPMAKDVYKSGFFFIEDTFYNDTRQSNNIDYSDVILKWAKSRNIGPFKVANMQDVQINSLGVRFGYPWVYQHQGCCEHLVVFIDARLITEDDDLALSTYPKIERIRPVPGKNCIMCGILNVRWITTEHDRIPHDTSYFCDKCFKSYNYVDGKKVGNFKAYKYPCIPELM